MDTFNEIGCVLNTSHASCLILTNNSIKQMPIDPVHRVGNWGTGRLDHLPKTL